MTAHGAGSSVPERGLDREATVVHLPSGRTLDVRRSRWQGPLDPEEVAYCRECGIPLAYDCAQIGWVPQACTDDAPIVVGEEPDVDLVAYTSPQEDARRLCDAVAARAARILAEERQPSAAAAALERLKASLAPRIAALFARHGVVAANRSHLAVRAVLARIEPPRHAAAVPSSDFTFRPWSVADAPRYRAMLDNPRLWEYLPESCPQPLTEETARTLIELGQIDARQEAFAVVLDGEPIGQCLLRFQEEFAGVRVAEVAYWLAQEHWGKGYMTRILPAFVELGFVQHGLDAIEAWIRADHAASARVADRSGLRRDAFAFEAELARALGKARAQRFVAYRGEFAALRARAAVSGAGSSSAAR